MLKHTNKLKGYVETRTNESQPYDKGDEKTSKAMDALNKNSWLYGKDGELIEKSIDQITLDDLSDEYQKDDEKVEILIKHMGLKLDEITKFEEEHPDKKVVSLEDYELLQKTKNKNRGWHLTFYMLVLANVSKAL